MLSSWVGWYLKQYPLPVHRNTNLPVPFVVLKDGGTAVDSAIASALCIGVINSFATGMSRLLPCHHASLLTAILMKKALEGEYNQTTLFSHILSIILMYHI